MWPRELIIAKTDQWVVTFDTFEKSAGKSTVICTRIRAPYVNRDGFRFTLHRAGIFAPLGEMLGFHDIKVGDEKFDKAFVLGKETTHWRRSEPCSQTRGIHNLMEDLPRIRVEVKDDQDWFGKQFPRGVDELYFERIGVVKDLAMLRTLFELFSEILHQLCNIGSAYETDPGIMLK